ncbi:hypothetical protein SARC_14747 [Sphaeroforma arctica JP610]|uniref:Uncharacterized protein n=1 Tax=Sphaeroforma arctica JP610 TaxID=667725 RepID=A0A0L0F9A7_9EUKA|nr:hypothetical protein SARC_14747 [Sphaeroforma arctica JP610]KNC72693.1 hypothetical protein SARC_14747 [Sphaeroforma arctica JP610]|eukprot:XP_014146595.1 hypothetical protein SARC_14747 [Sphaeroforma arctica JP610]
MLWHNKLQLYPFLYWLSKGFSQWCRLSFSVVVGINLVIIAFYPFEGLSLVEFVLSLIVLASFLGNQGGRLDQSTLTSSNFYVKILDLFSDFHLLYHTMFVLVVLLGALQHPFWFRYAVDMCMY